MIAIEFNSSSRLHIIIVIKVKRLSAKSYVITLLQITMFLITSHALTQSN